MGTHRSKHNKGRKPLYKEIERETVRKFEPEPISLQERFATAPLKRRPARVPQPILIDAVKRYLEQRHNRAVDETPVKGRGFEDRVAQVADAPEYQMVRASERDLLLQLFVEHVIHKTLFAAGRMWQHYMEKGSLQHPTTIVPGPTGSLHHLYQMSGDITEKQHGAMMTRRIIEHATGRSGKDFLDRILQPDIGRADLVRSGDYERCLPTLKSLLGGLAIVFRLSTGVNNASGVWQDARDELRNWRIKNALQHMSEGNPNVGGLLRSFDYEDQQFIRGLTHEINHVEIDNPIKGWRSPDQTVPAQLFRPRKGYEYGIAHRK